MKNIHISIVPPFEKPDPASDLTVFSPVKDYVPEYDTKDYLSQCMEYAIKYGTYLVPAVFSAFDYLCMTIIDREGNIFGYVSGQLSAQGMASIVEQTMTGQRVQ